VQGQLEELAWGQPVLDWALLVQEQLQERALLVWVPEPQLVPEPQPVPVWAPQVQEQEQLLVPVWAPQVREQLLVPVWAPLVRDRLLVRVLLVYARLVQAQLLVSAVLVLEQLLEQDLVLGPLVHGCMAPAPVDNSRIQTQIHSTAHLEERGIHLTRKVEEVDKEPLCMDRELGTEPEPLGSLYTVGEPGMDMVLVLGMFPLRRRAWSW
jgi:hypothetical protein